MEGCCLELVLDSIRKVYGKKVALHDFSEVFTPGVYGLLGPNGAGKTTLMRVIADVLRPTGGRVMLNGKDKDELDEGYRDIVGYLPQDLGLYGSFTGRKFLMYVAALKGLRRQEAAVKVEDLARITNLSECLDTHCGKYSGGMKRRLGIAQALLNDPRILILDEPTAGLDPMERIRFRNLISQISKDRIVLLSTHIVSDADMIAKQIILLGKGRIVEQGTVADLQASMQGRVWSARLPQACLAEISERLVLTNVAQKEGDVEVRIVCERKPLDGAVPAQPVLEDCYLYHFKYLAERGEW